MFDRKWVRLALFALPALFGGIVFAIGQLMSKPAHAGYICPITGEELPCPKCCPLNHGH